MIHPQYLIALIDVGICQFKIINKYGKYTFEFNVYLNDVQTLYKIKHRFKSGKVIELTKNKFILKITSDLDKIILFCQKNSILNRKQHITFQRWAYLYQKLILEKDKPKSFRESLKISRRLEHFSHMI